MSVLIKGMEKPEHCGYCRFRYDGICHALQKTQYSMNECPLVVIDDVVLNDTISRQAAIDALNKMKIYRPLDSDRYVISDCLNKIVNLPSAQPERKKGKWIIDPKSQDGYCSECKCDMPVMFDDWEYKSVATDFCPNCGADMREREEE